MPQNGSNHTGQTNLVGTSFQHEVHLRNAAVAPSLHADRRSLRVLPTPGAPPLVLVRPGHSTLPLRFQVKVLRVHRAHLGPCPPPESPRALSGRPESLYGRAARLQSLATFGALPCWGADPPAGPELLPLSS